MENATIQDEVDAFKEVAEARVLNFYRMGQRALRVREESPDFSTVLGVIADNAEMPISGVKAAMRLAEWMADEGQVVSLLHRRNARGEQLTFGHVVCLLMLSEPAARERFLTLALSRCWSSAYLGRKINEYRRGPIGCRKPVVPRTLKGFLSSVRSMGSRFIDSKLGALFDDKLLRPLRRVEALPGADAATLDSMRKTQVLLDQLAVKAADRSEELLAVIARLEASSHSA